MDQRTGALAEEVTQTIARREGIAEKLVALERRLTEAAGNATTTYSRMVTETTKGPAMNHSWSSDLGTKYPREVEGR